MGQFASGVTVVTTAVDGTMRGMTANAFMSGSLAPPLCVISVAKRARMHGVLREARRFVVNVLSTDQSALAVHFAGQPEKEADFQVDWLDGLPVLDGTVATMAADTVAEHDCGDHSLFVGQLFHMSAEPDRPPLVYHQSRFTRLRHGTGDQEVPGPEFW